MKCYHYFWGMSTTEPSSLSIWGKLKAALKGTEADYTKISLKNAIFLLAVPMILELVMESTFAVVDIFFVSKLGPSAVAAVGLTETYLFLLYSIAMGLSMAVTAIVARRVGEKKKEEAGEVAVQSIILALLASIPFALAGIFYAKELMLLMGADAWILEEGFHYTQWMLGGNLVIMLIFVINAIFRGAGDAAIAGSGAPGRGNAVVRGNAAEWVDRGPGRSFRAAPGPGTSGRGARGRPRRGWASASGRRGGGAPGRARP